MQITNGVQLHFMKTEKFKDIGISIRFRSELGPLSWRHPAHCLH